MEEIKKFLNEFIQNSYFLFSFYLLTYIFFFFSYIFQDAATQNSSSFLSIHRIEKKNRERKKERKKKKKTWKIVDIRNFLFSFPYFSLYYIFLFFFFLLFNFFFSYFAILFNERSGHIYYPTFLFSWRWWILERQVYLSFENF